jgi:four helix bundle protein
MARIERFEDLEIRQLAKTVANQIYDITSIGKFSQDYVLRDQIRRAVVSIFSNIAEDFERNGNKEFLQFLSIAKASCGEMQA